MVSSECSIENIIILAAGEGRRFFKSGGKVLKQLVPFNGIPLVRRIVLQALRLNIEGKVIVVVGEDEEQVKQIKQSLTGIDGIQYVKNEKSRADNNFYSVKKALECCSKSASIIIEADCVFEDSDLSSFASSVTNSSSIIWGCIGAANNYENGGVLVPEHKDSAWQPHIASGDEYRSLAEQPGSLKMFGIVGISHEQTSRFFEQVADVNYDVPSYFHQVFF